MKNQSPLDGLPHLIQFHLSKVTVIFWQFDETDNCDVLYNFDRPPTWLPIDLHSVITLLLLSRFSFWRTAQHKNFCTFFTLHVIIFGVISSNREILKNNK
jgi:hypothetical protein